MNLIELSINILATWRITHFLNREDGPYNLGNRMRQATGQYYTEASECTATNEIGKALCCFHCTSVWVALGVVLLQTGKFDLMKVFAVSAAAILLDEWRTH